MLYVLLKFFYLLDQESKFLKFLGFMWNPLSWVMEMAAIMAIALANGGVCQLIFPIQLQFMCSCSIHKQQIKQLSVSHV